MALLGEDGSGYELAVKLEERCTWRAWLGDTDYELLRPHLISSLAWLNFLGSQAPPDSTVAHLQLRARALLFDRALGCLFTPSTHVITANHLNPPYLQLQADDVYFSLERDAADWAKFELDSSECVANSSEDPGSTLFVLDGKQRQPQDFARVSLELLGKGREMGSFENSSSGCLWYDQWPEKHLPHRLNWLARRFCQRKLPFGDQEALVRTSEKMGSYASFSLQARKRHQLIGSDGELTVSMAEDNLIGDSVSVPPEIMFPGNCIPENPVPNKRRREHRAKNSSAAGVEKETISEDEAQSLVQQTVVRLIAAAGYESLKQGALDVLCELLVCYIRKLGHGLRLILDSYQRHHTPAELLRMYLYTAGGSSNNVRSLIEYLRNDVSISLQADQPQQHKSGPMQQNSTLSLGPQRQLTPQVQFLSQQNLMQQQQLQLDRFTRRRQFPNTRIKKFDKDRMLRDVKVDTETVSETLGTANETKPFVSLLSPQSHQQWSPQHLQQPMLQVSQPHHPQVLQQFKQQL